MNQSPFRFAGLAVSVLAGACARSGQRSDSPADRSTPDRVVVDSGQRERFKIQRADSSTFYPTIITTGTVAFSGDLSTQVLAPISGPVSRILVSPGARVER